MKPTILFSSFVGVLLLLAGVSYFFISHGAKAGAVITGVGATNIIGPGAQIVWTTDVPSDSRVAYGTISSVLNLFSDSRCDAGGYVTSHCINLTGLSPSTVYYYKVKSMDPASVDSQLAGFQFISASGGGDTIAPSIPTGLAAAAVSSSQINLSWTASTDDTGVAGYKIYRDGTQIGNVTVTNYSDTGLSSATSYAYTVLAYDAAGHLSTQSASASATTQSSSDIEAPTVSITVPVASTIISGIITVSASASDNVGVVGVQFKMDGANLGTEDTVSPYSTSWNTPDVSNGSHTLTAIARDAAGNTKISAQIIVTVSNTSTTSTTSTDTAAPSAPTGLTAIVISSSQINLSWSASTDNVGVAGYKIYKDGTHIDSVTSGMTYSSIGLLSGTSYSYTVSAFDAAGNMSTQSASTSGLTTMTATGGGTATETFTPVTFSVNLGTPVCKEGHTVAPVSFAAIPDIGGYFTINNQPIPALSSEFPNGTYFWNGIPKSGYAVSGTASGTFTVPALDACSLTTTAVNTSPTPTDTNTTTVQTNPHAYIALWQGDTNVLPGQTIQGNLRVNIGVENAESVSIYLKKKDVVVPILLGQAVRATDRPSLWRFAWDSKTIPDGDAELFSRIKNSTGEYAGDGVFIRVKNTVDGSINTSTAAQTTSIVNELFAHPENLEIAKAFLSEKIENFLETSSVEEKQRAAQKIRKDLALDILVSDTGSVEVQVGTTLLSRKEEPERILEEIKKAVENREGASVLEDTDKDTVSDYDETYIYNTDPKKADSDGDKINDGEEILLGMNPLKNEVALVSYENPKEVVVAVKAGVKEFTVDKIILIPGVVAENGSTTKEQIALKGTALPNSFVMLYIFSTPVVVTVKTDNDGKWEYTMDKELEDGNHEIYVAMTESAGKILVKSPAIPFVKTAQAVTLSSDFALANAPTESPSGFFRGGTLTLSLVVLFIILGLSFMIISFVSKKKESSDE